MVLDLTNGICETDQYKAWKFPGGEIHFQLDEYYVTSYDTYLKIKTSLKSSDDIMFLLLVVDTFNKLCRDIEIEIFITYMAYQQADRDFGECECFSLKTVCNLINSMNVDHITVYDAHSDVTGALLNNCKIIDNSDFISDVISKFEKSYFGSYLNDKLIILAPDGGAYKKIFALCEKIGFKGQIECCAKSRNHETGKKTFVVPKFDENKDVLIIDDICLAGGTFLGIKSQIKNKCYLAVSHGIFNEGIEHLLKEFEMIFTTDSRCNIQDNDRVKIFKL